MATTKERESVFLSATVTPELKAKLDGWARLTERTRSATLRLILESATLADLERRPAVVARKAEGDGR
jgi:predicted transcriptional regulator